LPRFIKLLAALGLAAATGCATQPGGLPMAPMQELAPAGKLRVGIGVGSVSSAFWATRDAATGKPKGVTVSLGENLANRLGVPLQLVVYSNSGEVTAGGPRGEWDVAFMLVDAERANMVDFGPPYFLAESTYLVPAGSTAVTIADVDRPGARVIGIAGTTTARAAARTLKNTTVQTFRTTEELTATMRAGTADAVALGRESLQDFSKEFPGSRVLPGHFQATGVAVAVPKNHPAALAWVTSYMEQAKASGAVRKALDDNGMKDAAVAPAGPLKPD
jgi:polar amino acid transport system substrate-binding protein